jgi:hypothetical protein
VALVAEWSRAPPLCACGQHPFPRFAGSRLCFPGACPIDKGGRGPDEQPAGGELFAGKHVSGEDLRRGGKELVGVGHQCRRNLAVDVRLASVLASEGVEDPERGR